MSIWSIWVHSSDGTQEREILGVLTANLCVVWPGFPSEVGRTMAMHGASHKKGQRSGIGTEQPTSCSIQYSVYVE